MQALVALLALAGLPTLLMAAPQAPHYHMAPQEYGPPKPYAFNYMADLLGGRTSRQESADGSGRVVGSYTLHDDDGRQRTVEYVADESGFRASVHTNEPGTKSENPADVVFDSTAPEPVLPLMGAGGHRHHADHYAAASRPVPAKMYHHNHY